MLKWVIFASKYKQNSIRTQKTLFFSFYASYPVVILLYYILFRIKCQVRNNLIYKRPHFTIVSRETNGFIKIDIFLLLFHMKLYTKKQDMFHVKHINNKKYYIFTHYTMFHVKHRVFIIVFNCLSLIIVSNTFFE